MSQEGQLLSQPMAPTESGPLGLHRLGLAEGRDGWIYVPPAYRPARPLPLVLMLHGAGGGGHDGLMPFLAHTDEQELILLAPDARGRTWDVIRGGYGPDVEFIDRALGWLFRRYAVDPARIAVEGFSDGASYALSLGIINGLLFTHIIAFSPGFMAPSAQEDAPRVFVSHGSQDPVLPIERCSRRLVPMLERLGYDVVYHEFEGGHLVPPDTARGALQWFLK